MSRYELTPLLTEKDEGESSEGSLDPLGTEPLADKLANQQAPGVRERQQHPRFLTATAASLCLCADLGEDAVGRDGVTEPWLVFEWYVVQGLVMMEKTAKIDLRGVPGTRKAREALDAGVPLSPKRDIKAPATFGFHAGYRGLAEALGIERGGQLGELGSVLLRLGSEDPRLAGFGGTGKGRGK